jgi:hypothetical protein
MIPHPRRRPPTWRELQADTAPWAEQLQFKFFREAPAWRKLEIAGDLTRGAILLTVAELERRFPQASPAEIRRRLADKLLGPELAARVYGPLVSDLTTDGQPAADDGHDA